MNEKTKQKWALAYEITLVTLAFISVLFIWTDNIVLLLIDRFIWLAFSPMFSSASPGRSRSGDTSKKTRSIS
ncbi:hypothetical protein U0355_01855 [Salimicrobium sp. PL1-032A]|uniref:hypothetical protein n=1 Tax=Salimicrobium sp. PL1-032A TaxID=3095364 RepID=UPI00325FFEFF